MFRPEASVRYNIYWSFNGRWHQTLVFCQFAHRTIHLTLIDVDSALFYHAKGQDETGITWCTRTGLKQNVSVSLLIQQGCRDLECPNLTQISKARLFALCQVNLSFVFRIQAHCSSKAHCFATKLANWCALNYSLTWPNKHFWVTCARESFQMC